MTELDEWGLAYMDEIPTPEPLMTRKEQMARLRERSIAGMIPDPPARNDRRKLSREDAVRSLARYEEEHGKKGTRKAYAALGDDVTLSRFVKTGHVEKPRKFKNQRLPGFEHPAVIAGRSIFSNKGVKSPDDVANVFVSGHANVKIGRDVRKGKLFRGYWIYTLTLEERATCPRTCHHWATCYGNNMPFAKRLKHSQRLERRIERDVAQLLNVKGREGILIRLHALGDFYSERYVALWDALLKLHPRLAVYGYTARRPGDPIGDAIAKVKAIHGPRFAIRYSDGGEDEDCTVSIMSADDCPPSAFVCPEQSGKTRCCATCGLCWNTDKNVAFVEH